MRILLIAPINPKLPNLDAEVASIDSFHEVTPLVGVVREVDITDAIALHPEGWDILWWATHAGDAGVEITDEVLTADGVGQYLLASQARLCVLNACASESLARQIIVGTDCDIIYTISDVLDTDALRFGSLLAGELSKTDNFHDAFDKSAPKKGRYRYLPAIAAIRALDMTVSSELQKLGARVDEGVRSYQSMQQSSYKLKVDTDNDRTRVVDIQQKMNVLQEQFNLFKQRGELKEASDNARKEERDLAMGSMDRRINTVQGAAITASVPAPISLPVPVPIEVKHVQTPLSTWILIGLFALTLLTIIFYIWKVL